jgi:hypothetical protein
MTQERHGMHSNAGALEREIEFFSGFSGFSGSNAPALEPIS